MKKLVFLAASLLLSACNSANFTAASTSSSSSGSSNEIIAEGDNVMKITMGCGYINEPCVSVTICSPGTSSCQTIPNILLDTGSYGLRLFSSVVSVSLTQQTDASSRSIAECVGYADGSGQWGPVKYADIVLGNEKASNVPIQVIDASFGTVPSGCSDLDTDPDSTGFNGILGVGLFTEDCGSTCTTSANAGVYYACSGSSCSGATVAIANQVSNPVSFLSTDNNGVVVVLPSISSAGASSASGYMLLGIGTETNNTPGSVNFFAADSSGNFKTTYGGRTYSAFIDSGSNGLFFPSSSIATCSSSSGASGFYCPSSSVSTSATQIAASGANSLAVSFNIANSVTLLNSGNIVFNNLGGYFSGYFDWGLPFFLGRSVYVGTENKNSSLGTGPYWAY